MKLFVIIKIAAGFMALIFGGIGIFIPIFPTTPFILFSIACFSSMPAMQKRILKIKLFREYYERYANGESLSHGTVVSSLVFLWAMLIISAILIKSVLTLAILAAVGAGVTAHILFLAKPVKQSEDKL